MIEEFLPGMIPSKLKIAQLAKYIDHSLLHPTMTDKELEAGCAVALKYNTASVCIKPYAVKKAASLLSSSEVAVCTVIGFPHGSNTDSIKIEETIEACNNGAVEIDMVVNIGKVLSAEWDYVSKEIESINTACKKNGAILKVIFENDFLNTDQKIKLCEICSNIGVAFVKTSTGYGYVKQDNGMFLTRGATLEDIKLMRNHCTPEVNIKAAGGIRTLSDMLKAIDAGATRIGATATAAILEEVNSNLNSTLKNESQENRQSNKTNETDFDY
jgi:deoxyribose-phosphate aldolase